jgi:phytoene dehydrogenase-like protein
MNMRTVESLTIREWLDRSIADEVLRDVMEALVRVTTYSAAPEQSAGAALEQLRIAMLGVIYVHEGWQKLVDSLHTLAVSAGVNFVTSSRVIGLRFDHAIRGVELGGFELNQRVGTLSVALPDAMPSKDVEGTVLQASTVILAVDPCTASELVDEPRVTREWRTLTRITASCLDVALSKLPEPKKTFAVGIDAPTYLSVHSSFAQLTPRGGALIHAVKYRPTGAPLQAPDDFEGDQIRLSETSRREQVELEALLDDMQPGWRDVLVHRRFLPAVTVSNALRLPATPRPAPETPIRGLYVAGDWVGPEGALADAALSSARDAAKAILMESTA